MKVCTVCQQEKDLSMYYNMKASLDGKAYRCKDCDNSAVAAYRVKHKDRQRRQQRESNWKSKYGIDRGQFNSMWDSQLGLCGICSTALTNVELDGCSLNKPNKACVDHCHKTGQVRGLLCAKCNKGIGLLGDDLLSINNALRYLENADIH